MPLELIEDTTVKPLSTGKLTPVDEAYQYVPPENGEDEKIFYEPEGKTYKVNQGVGDYLQKANQAAVDFDLPESTLFEETAANFNVSQAHMALTLNLFGALSDEDAAKYASRQFAVMQEVKKRNPVRVQQFEDQYAKANGFFETSAVILGNLDVLGRQSISQMGNAVFPLVSSLAGAAGGFAVGGPIGAAVGSRTGELVASAIIETGSELDQIAAELGYDTGKQDQLIAFLSDEKVMEQARVRASTKGLSQGAIDTFMTMIGGRFVKKIEGVKGKVAGVVADAAGEGTAEAGAQQIARGEVDVKDAILESLTAGVSSTAQVGVSAIGSDAIKTAKMAKQELAQAAAESPAVAAAVAKVESGLPTTMLDQKKMIDEIGPEAASDVVAAMQIAKTEIVDTAGIYSKISDDGKTASVDVKDVGQLNVDIQKTEVSVSSVVFERVDQDSEARIAKVIGDIADAENKTVSSSGKISIYEAGAYEKVKQDGYNVVKNSAATKDENGFIVTPDGSPVYTVSPKIDIDFAPSPDAGPDAIKQAAELSKILSRKRPSRLLRSTVDVASGVGRGAAYALQPISTRVGKISPKIKGALRKFEGNLSMRVQRDHGSAEPYFKKIQKLTKRDKVILDFAMINGDIDTVNDVAKRNGFEKELKDIRKVLDAIYKRAGEVGLEVDYRENFFPRQVKNHKKFVEFFEKSEAGSSISEALILKAEESGRPLSFEEKAHLINTLLRGYKTAQITMSKPGALKERSIDFVTDEIFDFYAPMDQALLHYIDSVNEAIEARRFFGKKDISKQDENITESIGAYVLRELQDGNITALQVQELSDILKSRFSKAIMNPALRFYKNFSYIDTMGSFASTLTQIGDLVPALYKTGIYRSFVSLGKAAVGNVEITNKDLGIDKISQEFQDGDFLSKALDRVFSITQMKRVTNLMQNTFVDATLQQHRKMAQKPSPDYMQKLEYIFGEDAQSVVDDLKAGRNTDNVKLLLINDILDFQPIAKSEMPQLYLQSANSRIFYMLKSFTIKQLYDVYYRDVITPMAQGDTVKALSNLTRYAVFFVAMNASSDFLKNILLWREQEELDDAVVTNLLRLIGINKFITIQAQREGAGTAAAKMILPPFKFIDSLYKDMSALAANKKDINDLKVIDSIPVVGKMYYWWFGGGSSGNSKPSKGGEKLEKGSSKIEK